MERRRSVGCGRRSLGSQPQRCRGWLHGLVDHGQQLRVQGGQIELVAEAGAEGVDGWAAYRGGSWSVGRPSPGCGGAAAGRRRPRRGWWRPRPGWSFAKSRPSPCTTAPQPRPSRTVSSPWARGPSSPQAPSAQVTDHRGRIWQRMRQGCMSSAQRGRPANPSPPGPLVRPASRVGQCLGASEIVWRCAPWAKQWC